MTDNHRYCVIMCGGIGSRFWPYSRAARPKQFIDFFGTGRSLLQATFDRMLPLIDPDHIYVVTNEMYAPLVREQLPELSDDHILCEPARRNTAPCIAWAAYHIAAIDPEATMIVTPSDHIVTRETVFVECLERGLQFVAANDALLTLGITPVRPETGYGYIQIGKEVEPGIRRVKTFTEKPDYEMAKVFVESGEFFWNSGIFLWSAKSIIKALHAYVPEIAATFDRGLAEIGTPDEMAYINDNFVSCPSISIDYAVMEKADNTYVEIVSFGWNDLGTWGALFDNSPKNREHNVTQGCNVMAYDSTGNIFATNNPRRLIVVRGLNDYIIADADDVLLIYPRASEQEIKKIVDDVKMAHGDKYI